MTLSETLARSSVVAVARLIALWPDGSTRRVFDLDGRIILSGSVTAELRRDARRSGSLEIVSDDLAPVTSADPFAPGSRIVIERGAMVGQVPIYESLITGYVTTCDPSMSGRITLAVESHLSACAQEAGDGLVLPAGTFLPDALYGLWGAVLPGIAWTVDDVAASRSLGADIPVLATDSLLDVGIRLARDLGCVVYDDRWGRVVVAERPDPSSQTTVRVMTEPMDLTRSVGLQPFNRQPVEATPGDGEPFTVVVEVDDPASPIHKDRIGVRSAPTIRTDAAADPVAARAMARRVLAARAQKQDSLTVTNLPMHLDLDEGDVVERDESVSKTGGRFLIETIQYPVGPGYIQTTESSVIPLFLTDALV